MKRGEEESVTPLERMINKRAHVFNIINLNAVQHAQNSWKSCHPLKLLEGLLSDGVISVHNMKLQQVFKSYASKGRIYPKAYLLNVMNCGAFSTRALVTLDTHLDMDAWLIPIVSPMDVWNEPDV